MSIKIYSWNNGDGSKLLADAMGVKRIKHNNSRYRPRNEDKIINWGSTRYPFIGPTWINHPLLVANVIDKKTFFELRTANGGIAFNLPRHWTDRQSAEQYMRDNPGVVLVARTILRGYEGRGIVLVENLDQMVDAPLYTRYIKKKAEYRIHVVNGEVIDEVQKKRKRDHEGGDSRIRNTANGYVFARTDVVVPQCVRDAAVNAVQFYQLDFAAADVIYNTYENKAYVLELNTAPGLEGTTVTRYAEAFNKWLGV